MRRSPDPLIDRASSTFAARFGGPPSACGIAPGRVEILGNHTDYNGGCVLTAAIDRHVVAVGRPTAQTVVRAYSLDLDAAAEFLVQEQPGEPTADWPNYVRSVFAVLRRVGVPVGGVELAIAGEVPIGAGLGSSAALEAAVAMLILQLYPHLLERLELAKLLQQGENEFTGVRCGLLDQFSCLHGRADHVLFLDCASCEHEALPLGGDPPAIVICDSRVPRALGRDAPYNVRRRECEQARERLGRRLNRVLSGLCEVSSGELRQAASDIPEPLLSRAWHVITEQERVRAARDHLRAGGLDRVGALMIESHESSRTRFDNSCPALDRVCRAAASQPGHLGGRLCGAGWGGCTVHLVARDRVDAFVAGLGRSLPPTNRYPPVDIHVCYAAPGAWGRCLETTSSPGQGLTGR